MFEKAAASSCSGCAPPSAQYVYDDLLMDEEAPAAAEGPQLGRDAALLREAELVVEDDAVGVEAPDARGDVAREAGHVVLQQRELDVRRRAHLRLQPLLHRRT